MMMVESATPYALFSFRKYQTDWEYTAYPTVACTGVKGLTLLTGVSSSLLLLTRGMICTLSLSATSKLATEDLAIVHLPHMLFYLSRVVKCA